MGSRSQALSRELLDLLSEEFQMLQEGPTEATPSSSYIPQNYHQWRLDFAEYDQNAASQNQIGENSSAGSASSYYAPHSPAQGHFPLYSENIQPVQNRESHMLAERRRRRREAELLSTLKSLIPFPTKRDKLSILRGAIEYVEELKQQKQNEALEQSRNSTRTSRRPDGNGDDSATMSLTVPAEVLVPALSRLGDLGFEVEYLHLNPAETKVDLAVRSTKEGTPSFNELQQMLKQDFPSSSSTF